MKKVFLSLVAVLLCGVTFAQLPTATTPSGSGSQTDPYIISSASEFVWIASNNADNKYYEQTANIDLEDLGELTSSIIPTFTGIYDGKGYTITYQAGFKCDATEVLASTNYSLFGTVGPDTWYFITTTHKHGTIRNLNVNADVTLSGTKNNMNVALLCGQLGSLGVIENCNVSGNVNSTVEPSGNGGSDAGLLVGECAGTVKYCTGSGNVVGVGYAGGLIGQMKKGTDASQNPSLIACSFTGSVKAANPANVDVADGYGSFAGGICGHADNNSTIQFAVANATITSGWVASGTVSVNTSGGTTQVMYTYADGEIIITEISNENNTTVESNTTNSTNSNNTGNYSGNTPSLDEIVEALNNAIPESEKNNFYFAVVNGQVRLVIGQKPEEETICEAPTGLTVTENEGIFTATWAMESQDDYCTESNFVLTVTGGDLETEMVIDVVGATSFTSAQALSASADPYVFTVKSKCSEELSSAGVTYSLYVNPPCPIVSDLQAKNVTSTSANITWEGDAHIVKLDNEEIDFTNGQPLALPGLNPATTYTVEAIVNCPQSGQTTSLSTSITFTTHRAAYETAKTGDFSDPNTWTDGEVPQGTIAEIKINKGHIVTVYHDLKITGTYKITDNKGALRIAQGGQLINETDENVPGIVEIESVAKNMNEWSFVGAPFAGYQLKAVMPYPTSDVAMVTFNYETGNWSTDWATVGTTIGRGEGVFAWPFIDATMSFTTYGDMCRWNEEQQRYEIVAYDFVREGRTHGNSDYALNNGDVDVIKTIKYSTNENEQGTWMALSNPYPAKLNINAFLGQNSTNGIQGNCVYLFRNGIFDMIETNTNNGVQDILMTEGFFVNFINTNQTTITKTVNFTKEQLSYNYQPAPQAKSSANELIELTLQNGKDKVRVYFAHNEDAEQGYDIFDANKMFATTGVAEPYFVTDGIALIKEEVAELPYYATMNVRSQQDTVMNFVLTNLPEGYAVSIIDGEEVIDLVEGGVYSTEILTGENADRFKVLVKKNVGLADVEELDVTIINSNRHITITAQEDVKVTVYNTLGQRVFETEKTDFVLSGVASGAYVVKVQGAKAAKSQKIIVE